MAKHLPEPTKAREPDPDAAKIMREVEKYFSSDLDPVVTAGGLRHIYYLVEQLWDAAVARAKRTTRAGDAKPITYKELEYWTGDKLGTLQGRIRAHDERTQAPPRVSR